MKPRRKLSRHIITPYITFVFAATAISGLLMSFHIFDGYLTIMHELFGLVFVLFSLLHIIINWSSLKSHFPGKAFIASGLIVLAISAGLIAHNARDKDHKQVLLDKIASAPVAESFKLLGLDYARTAELLKKEGIAIGNANSIEEIGAKNGTSAREIIELILE